MLSAGFIIFSNLRSATIAAQVCRLLPTYVLPAIANIRSTYCCQRAFGCQHMFYSLLTTYVVQVIPTADPEIYETTQAPEPRDVVWANLPMSQSMRGYRTKIISIAVAALVGLGLTRADKG